MRFLTPLAVLTQFMGSDTGCSISYFFIMATGIKELWDSQPFPNDVRLGFGGVPLSFALAANKLFYAKWPNAAL